MADHFELLNFAEQDLTLERERHATAVKLLKKEWAVPADLYGAENVPAGFGECNGQLKSDPVVDPYLATEGVAAVSIS